jgi:hypothetical protein
MTRTYKGFTTEFIVFLRQKLRDNFFAIPAPPNISIYLPAFLSNAAIEKTKLVVYYSSDDSKLANRYSHKPLK